MIVEFEGQEFEFPDDATDDEINEVLNGASPWEAPAPAMPDGGAMENAATFAGAQTEGLPIVGPYLRKGVDHASAWAAQGLNALGLAPENSPAATMNHDQLMELAAKNDQRLKQENPNFATAGHIAGQVEGSIIAAEAMPWAFGQAAGQGLKAQIGLGMAGNAALTGADVASRGGSLEDVATEGGISAAVGGAAPLVGLAARGIGQFGGSIWRNGIFRPREAAANSRIAGAIAEDTRSGVSMGADELAKLREADAPVMNVDLYGDAVRGLAGDAVKNSDAASNLAGKTIDPRHIGQVKRSVETVEDLVGGPVNRTQVKANIREASTAATEPAYKRAMSMPHAQDVWSDRLQDLTSRPSVRRAMASAEAAAAERGSKIRSPFAHADGGEFRPLNAEEASAKLGLDKVDPNARIPPTLEYWDHVYKTLNREADQAFKSEAPGADGIRETAKAFRAELDSLVPEYKEARGVANEFFKASDAVEAGENLFKGSYQNLEEVQRNAMKFNSAEREGLKVGFAGALIEKLEKVTDTGELTNMLRNTAMRKKMVAAFGEEGADKIESMVATEVLFSAAKKATSVRHAGASQLAQYGTAGAMTGGYSASQGDFLSAGQYALVGVLSRAGYNKARRNIAEEIAKKLLSNDPNAIKEAVKIAARSKAHRETMLEMAAGITKAVRATGTTMGEQFNQ